jgi:preprotein translocase subunit SecA
MLQLLLGDPNARKLNRYQPVVSDINLLEEEIAPLSYDKLRGLTAEFRQKLEPRNGAAQNLKDREILDFLGDNLRSTS